MLFQIRESLSSSHFTTDQIGESPILINFNLPNLIRGITICWCNVILRQVVGKEMAKIICLWLRRPNIAKDQW